MYTIFNRTKVGSSTSLYIPVLDYANRTIRDEHLARYKDYRRGAPILLLNDHILLRVINSLEAAVDFSGDLTRYYDAVNQTAHRIGGTLGLTNSSRRGQVFNQGHFYGPNISEVILLVTEEPDLRRLWKEWEIQAPVKVISHPIKGMTVADLNGKVDTTATGYAVMTLDAGLLMCQYQMWKVAIRMISGAAGTPPTTAYLSACVLPNIMDSHLEVAMLNTIMSRAGIDMFGEMKTKLPFYMSDMSGRVESATQEILDKARSSKLFFHDLMGMIPTLDGKSWRDKLPLPDVAHTNQVIWLLVMARLNILAFFLVISDMNDNSRNDAEINRIGRSLSDLKSGKELTNGLPRDTANYIQKYLDEYFLPHFNKDTPA